MTIGYLCRTCEYGKHFEETGVVHCYPPIPDLIEVSAKYHTPYQEALCIVQKYKYYKQRGL
jgi:hypothetical protein